MDKGNFVYLGCSLDGYIAGPNGELDWLDSVPIPEGIDMGYGAFMDRIDALVMGRNSFETVLGFNVPWPYKKPVFVFSSSLKEVPSSHKDKAFLISGTPDQVVGELNGKGYNRLYIDGGQTVQGFMQRGLIDEMTLTKIPIVLGNGIPLWGELKEPQRFELVSSQVFADHIVQDTYRRKPL